MNLWSMYASSADWKALSKDIQHVMFMSRTKCVTVFCPKHQQQYNLITFEDHKFCKTDAAQYSKQNNIASVQQHKMQFLPVAANYKLVLRDTFENRTPFDAFSVKTSLEWSYKDVDYLCPDTQVHKAKT
jgi:hypothetical protein